MIGPKAYIHIDRLKNNLSNIKNQIGNKSLMVVVKADGYGHGAVTIARALKNEDKIDGVDGRISLPVQTADPDKYGGDTINLYFGLNLAGQTGLLRDHRLALEAGIPIHQDLNGPQMESDYVVTIGWQYAWHWYFKK